MCARHLEATDVVVQLKDVPCHQDDEVIVCRVHIWFESRNSQHYYVVISKATEACQCFVRGRAVPLEELVSFLQSGVWLHVAGESRLMHGLAHRRPSLEEIRSNPDRYTASEVHLVAKSIEILASDR